MRDFMQVRVRQKIEWLRPRLREKFDKLCPLSTFNDSDQDLPENVKDCVILGKVKLGKNSKLYGSLVGDNVELEIGDNTVVYASAFAMDGVGKCQGDFYVKKNGSVTKVHIGSNCMIDRFNCMTSLDLGDNSIILNATIRREELAYRETPVPIKTKVVLGKDTVIAESAIVQYGIDHTDKDLQDLVIGDGLVMNNRSLMLRSTNNHFGKNLLLCGYTVELPQLLSEEPPDWIGLKDSWHTYTKIGFFRVDDDSHVIHIGKFNNVYIGDDVYVAIILKWLAADEPDSELHIGDRVIIATNKSGYLAAQPEYKTVARKWIIGNDCTLCCMNNLYNRPATSTPNVVKVNDGLNVGIRYDYEACPVTAIHVASDGYYNI